VLTGGASTRMGTDKAFLVVDGEPMARRVAGSLEAAGATRVIAVGGDLDGLRGLGLDVVADQHPGEGPLGGILTALDATTEDIVVVLACDLPGADPGAITAVVEALGDADVAAPLHDGRHELLHAAYGSRAQPVLAAAFAAGERAVHRAVRELTVVGVTGLADRALADADTPDDLGLDTTDGNHGGVGSG
jgi:molybdopterin-guanine dinucleotide biosynthesis protein A